MEIFHLTSRRNTSLLLDEWTWSATRLLQYEFWLPIITKFYKKPQPYNTYMPKVATQALAGNVKMLQHGKSLWANLHLCWFTFLRQSNSSFAKPRHGFMAIVTILAGKLSSISPAVPWQILFPISPPTTSSIFYSICPFHYCCAGPLSINVVFSVEFSLACSLLYKTPAYLTVCPS